MTARTTTQLLQQQHHADMERQAHDARLTREVTRTPSTVGRRVGGSPGRLRRLAPRIAALLCLTVPVAVALVVSASAASAAPPSRSTVVLDETFTYPVGGPNPCPFEVTYHNEGTFFVSTFVDANGTTVRELDRGAYFLESYSANGKVISSKSPAMVHIDPATNTLVGTGSQRHFNVPGLGTLYAQAGRFVIDLNTGETIAVSGLDVPLSDQLCVALAP